MTFIPGIMKLFKYTILFISLLLFFLQVKNSLVKLQKPPMIVSHEKVDISDIKPPLITICTTPQQLPVCDSRENDGCRKKNLLGMMYGDNVISWGDIVNKTFEKVWDEPNEFFESVMHLKPIITSKNGQRLDTKKVFFPKFGICWNLLDYDPTYDLEIQTDNFIKPEALILVTDPNQQTNFNIALLSNIGDKINLIGAKKNVYNIKVEIDELYNPRREGTCKDYDPSETFKVCVDEKLKDVLLPQLGCMPPWLSADNQCICTYTGQDFIKFNATLSGKEFTEDIINPLLDLKKTKAEQECLPHCLKMKNIVSLQWIEESEDADTKVILQFEQEVLVSKTIVTYFLSDFAVDIGSSLGFWLGLSVFGVADLVGTVASRFKSLIKKSL